MTALERAQPGEPVTLTRRLSASPDPVDLFATLCGPRPPSGSLLLETADVAEGTTGRSLLVVRSALRIAGRGERAWVEALGEGGLALLPWLQEQLAGVAETRREGAVLECVFPRRRFADETRRVRAPSPLDVPRTLMRLAAQPGDPLTTPLLAGVFGYDLLGAYEELPEAAADVLGWPDFELWLPDRAVVLDHAHRSAVAVAHLFGGEDPGRRYGQAAAAIQSMADALQAATPMRAAPAGDMRLPEVVPDVEVDLDDDAFASLVARLKSHITTGDVFQIVPSRTFSMPCADPLAAYRRLRRRNPSPYMFFVPTPRGVLFGASPETALEVEGASRRVHVRPIAGTRPRGRRPDGTLDRDLDARLEAELRLDDKERAEHMMLVDLARNDVARVAETGSREVVRLLEVERYSQVMHLVSHVRGKLRAELDALHAYALTMNMGTVVGAPKIRAAQLLRENEPTRRGPYGGAVGWVSAEGSLGTAIVIRSAAVQDGTAYVRAGAGVVHDSSPRAEAEETRRKALAVLDAIRRTEELS